MTDLAVRPTLGIGRPSRPVMQGEADMVTGLQAEHPSRGPVVDLIRAGPVQEQHVRSAPRHQDPLGVLNPGPHDAVFGSRLELHGHVDQAFGDLEDPGDNMRRRPTDVVATLGVVKDQSIGQRRRALRGHEGGLQDQRVLYVAPRGPERRLGLNRPVTGTAVDEPPKHRRRIEAWKAQPVNGAGHTHQGRGMAVGQQPVVANRPPRRARISGRQRWLRRRSLGAQPRRSRHDGSASRLTRAPELMQ